MNKEPKPLYLIQHFQRMKNLKEAGSYILAEKLGQGSFGKVYKGIHKETKEQVALKFIGRKNTRQQDIKAIIAQNQILKQISHENIIRLIEYFQTPTDLVIVMDYAGTTLQEVFENKKRFNIQEIKNYSRQIFSAMLYLSERKIAHRDLKPQNILIKDGIIKLCDFGFAKKISASTQFMTSVRGTPLYIAPEIVKHQPYTDKVDVWSFGVIIYEFFCGRAPFHDLTIEKVINKILNQKVIFPPSMPSQLKQILRQMLNKNPVLRIGWEKMKEIEFFQRPKPLNQIKQFQLNKEKEDLVKNIQQIGIVKKASSEQEEEIPVEDYGQPVKNLTKDDQTLVQLKNLEQDLIKYTKGESSIDAIKAIKTNEVILHKILAVLRSKLADESVVQKNHLENVYNILTILITKVKLISAQEISEDITKRKQIIFAILKIAEQDKDPIILSKEFMLIGFLTKNNFDGHSIDFDTDQQIVELCLKEIKQPTSKDCFNHALKIMGILASQAMITLNSSQDFFIKIEASKALSVISESYEPIESKILVLECLEKFIHPSISTKIQHDQLYNCFAKMKEQVATVLVHRQFFKQDPLKIYSTPQARQYYAKICYECLKSSALFIKQFIKYPYWQQFVHHKNLRIYSLAFDNICIEKQNSHLLSNQLVHEQLISSSSTSQMQKVFLIARAGFNLIKKQTSSKKKDHIQSLLLNTYQVLLLEEERKVKACQEIEQFFCYKHRIFQETLCSTICSILEDPNIHKLAIDEGVILSIFKNLLCFKAPHQELRVSKKSAARCIMIREQFIRAGSTILKEDAQLISIIFNLFNTFIEHDTLSLLLEEMGVNFTKQLVSSFFGFMKVYGGNDEKGQLSLYRKAEDKGFHEFLLGGQMLDKKSLHFCLHILLKIAPQAKYFDEIVDVIGLALPKIKPYTKLETTDIQIIILVIQSVSLLVRKNLNYVHEIKSFGIISQLPLYLKSFNETLIHQTLTLIGNLAKHSTFFFDEFAHHQLFQAMRQAFINHGHGTKNRVIKALVYSIGNISFYNDRFYEEIKPMIGIFQTALNLKDSYLIQNSLSTISNLLRHSDCYIECLVEHNIIKRVIQIVMASKGQDNFLNFGLNLLKKAIMFQKTFNYHRIQEFEKIYYDKKNVVSSQNQFMKVIKNKIDGRA